MASVVSRSKASSHPTKDGGIYVGIVKSVTPDGKAHVFVPKLGNTFGPLRMLNASVNAPIEVNVQVLCAHINASTTEMYILGYVNAADTALGATGPTGPTGPTGITGATGPTGPTATSTAVVRHQVKAGESITKGQAVYVSSADGTNMIVSKATNANEAGSTKTMGLIDATVVLNGFANVVTEGLLANIDTSAASAGDAVYLGTNGNLVYGFANKPVAPAHLVSIGVVTKANSSTGEIFVRVVNGFELDELHNVLITNPADKDALVYNAATGLWKNTVASSDPMNDSKFSAIILMDIGV